MREITINLTDNGWEMLVNGVPSPRFARYMRNLEWIRSWSGTLLDLFVLGPARYLALGVAMLLVTGQMAVGASAGPEPHDVQVTLHFESSRYAALATCTPEQAGCPS